MSAETRSVTAKRIDRTICAVCCRPAVSQKPVEYRGKMTVLPVCHQHGLADASRKRRLAVEQLADRGYYLELFR